MRALGEMEMKVVQGKLDAREAGASGVGYRYYRVLYSKLHQSPGQGALPFTT